MMEKPTKKINKKGSNSRFLFTNTLPSIKRENGVQKDNSVILENDSTKIDYDTYEKKAMVLPADKEIQSLISRAVIPRETTGSCKNSLKIGGCKQYNVTLGNNLCMGCWDKRTGGKRYAMSFKE